MKSGCFLCDKIGTMIFKNRQDAGKKLAVKLQNYQKIKDLIVLGIPRGGIVIGKQLSQAFKCPLDIIITKKIGAPGNPELAIGAIGLGGEKVIDERLAAKVGADEEYLEREMAKVKKELKRRIKKYQGNRTLLNLKNKMIVLTDDGVATGTTMLAAIEVVRQHEPKRIIVAVPVIARDSLAKIEAKADKVVYLDAPLMFFAVGQFYKEFEQISDREAIQLLK